MLKHPILFTFPLIQSPTTKIDMQTIRFFILFLYFSYDHKFPLAIHFLQYLVILTITVCILSQILQLDSILYHACHLQESRGV